MISAVLAAIAALAWGGSDYCGGKAARHAAALAVTVVSQVLGLPALLLCALLLSGRPDGADLAWGAGAGAAELAALVLLYRALAVGPVMVAMPVSTVTTALVSMAVGLATGRAPGRPALAGAACAVVAIVLVGTGPAGSGPGRGRAVPIRMVATACAAGVMFGAFFSLLARTTGQSGLLPLLASRSVSICLGLAVASRQRVSLRPPRQAIAWAAPAGAGEVAASVCYLLAVRSGLLSVVGPIVSLSPASTVLLALAIDRERPRPAQAAGLGLAVAAVLLAAV